VQDAEKGVALHDPLRAEGRAAKFIRTNVTDWDPQLQLFPEALTWLDELAPAGSGTLDRPCHL